MKEFIYPKEIYTVPCIVRLEEPKVVKLKDRRDFLESVIDPDKFVVYQVERFCYGDFDNHVTAVVKDKVVDPKYSHYYEKTGLTDFSVRTDFWYFIGGKAFWLEQTEAGYSGCEENNTKKTIEDLETTVEEVFIISKEDIVRLNADTLHREEIK